MIPNPILKVLSSMQKHRVRCLLMGGQACVFYGAAEFSRDSDFAILAEPENLERLQAAMTDLQAEVIAVPPFTMEYLQKGHAVHFRCQHPECAGLRVDVMAVMRGVESFAALWERRTVLALPDGTNCDLLSIPDLVRAKKTQRDKDWPMIRRLLEVHYFEHRDEVTGARLEFWLQELRTADLLLALARQHPKQARDLASTRPLLHHALEHHAEALEAALQDEEREERRRDRDYWQALKQELESLRRNRH